MFNIRRVIWVGCVAGLLFVVPREAGAQTPLSGSGNNLGLGTAYSGQAAAETGLGDVGGTIAVTAPAGGNGTNATAWTGSWIGSAAPAAWQGTYSASGPETFSGTGPDNGGTTTFNFSGLPDGNLPAGTYFLIDELNNGDGKSAQDTLTAYDGGGNVITTPWLDGVTNSGGNDVLAQYGSGTGSGGPILSSDMAAWEWQGAGNPSGYYFNGAAATLFGGFILESNTPIASLSFNRNNFDNGFGIGAGTAVLPEPASTGLLAVAAIGLLRRARRRQPCAASNA
jgi:hypothetical protein